MLSASLRSEIGGVLYQAEMGISGVALPPDPIQGLPSYRAALAKFDALPEIRVLFDNGAGKGPLGNGSPVTPTRDSWRPSQRFPIPGTRARSWYLGPHGSLAARAPAGAAPIASPGTRARVPRPTGQSVRGRERSRRRLDRVAGLPLDPTTRPAPLPRT